MEKYIVFALSNPQLTKNVIRLLNAEEGKIVTTHFADGEVLVKSDSDVTDKHVVIILSTSQNVHEELFSLLLLLNSINHSKVKCIDIVMPYFAYSRQERSYDNEPVSCEVVANILDTAKFDRLICFDLHHPIIETFLKHNIINKPTTSLFVDYYSNYFNSKNIDIKDVVIICPDHGSNNRADMLAKALNCTNKVIMTKHRPSANKAEHLMIDGDEVKGKHCLLIDDIIDTGGTVISAIDLLLKNNAKSVLVGATHGVFSQNCISKIIDAGASDLVISNSIEKQLPGFVKVADLAELVIDCIKSK